MAELFDVVNALFKKTNDWNNISDDDKINNFFIINRFLSKKYPEKAQLLNSKNINKLASIELWYHFLKKEPYPKWFWSKSPKNKSSEKIKISNKDQELLLRKLRIKNWELIYLIDKHPKFIKEELKYYKDLEKQ